MRTTINVGRARSTEEICYVIALLNNYFKPYEMVSSNEIQFYHQSYSKLFPGEDYFIYKITYDDRIIGGILGVVLSEFVVIDYFVIEKQFRTESKEVFEAVIDKIRSFKKPVVIEAESEALCRLYRMNGFKRFTELYEYPMANVSLIASTIKIEMHKSNLLYLGKDGMIFDEVKNILYHKHYLRWYSIYRGKYYEEYLTTIKGIS